MMGWDQKHSENCECEKFEIPEKKPMATRILSDVIDKIVKEIPQDQTNLILGLQGIRQSALYAAPEIMPVWWQKVCTLLNQSLPWPPVFDWQRKIAAIIRNEEL